MAQYKMKALNCHIKGNVYYKRDNPTFDGAKYGEAYLKDLERAGYLEKLPEKATKQKPKTETKPKNNK